MCSFKDKGVSHYVKRLCQLLCLLILLCSFIPCPEVFAKETAAFGQLPLGEHWYGIFLNTDRVGFSRQVIAPAPGGYRIEVDGSFKVLVLGYSREVLSKESYLVNDDLTLRSFSIEQTMGTQRGQPLT